jgi:hypothetical protein
MTEVKTTKTEASAKEEFEIPAGCFDCIDYPRYEDKKESWFEEFVRGAPPDMMFIMAATLILSLTLGGAVLVEKLTDNSQHGTQPQTHQTHKKTAASPAP